MENITFTQSSWITGGWGELLDQRYFAGVSQRKPSHNRLESSYYTGKSLRNKGLHEVELSAGLNSVKPFCTECRDLLRSFYFILFYFSCDAQSLGRWLSVGQHENFSFKRRAGILKTKMLIEAVSRFFEMLTLNGWIVYFFFFEKLTFNGWMKSCTK